MGILEDFPMDPFTPSVGYMASCLLPLWVPWAQESIKLGTSLIISHDYHRPSQFLDDGVTAFTQKSLHLSRLMFSNSSTGNITSAQTMGSTAASEHVDLTIAGQIGGSFAGALGRAKYEKSVTANDSVRYQQSIPSRCQLLKSTYSI